MVGICGACSARPPYVSASSTTDANSVKTKGVQFRPCIDIHQGKVKQIVGSTLIEDCSGKTSSLVTNFETEQSAAAYAELYAKDNLFGGHVIMLGSHERSKKAALEALRAFPGGFQVGGGVTPENAKEYLDNEASHVIVTSYIFTDGKLDYEKLKKLVHTVSKKKVVIDLSCRKKGQNGPYTVVTDRWQRFTDLVLSVDEIGRLSYYADEFLVHGVDVEGKQLGVDEELVRLLGEWSPIPVTYAGGVSTMSDLEIVKKAGGGAVNVTVGSALDIFGGKLPYAKVVEWHKKQQELAKT